MALADLRNTHLSICIPTYNRSAKLRACLEELVPQARRHGVDIFVSDNASTDDTPQVVRGFQDAYGGIRYARNPRNVLERNFEVALKMSDTRFAWLLSDDDRLAEGAIARVLAIVEAADYDMVVVNGYDGRVRNIPSTTYRDRNRLLADLCWHMSWISVLVFGRGMIEAGRFERYDGTYLIQVGTAFDYLAARDIRVYWEAASCVSVAKAALPVWHFKTFEIFGANWCDVIRSLPDGYSDEARRAAMKSHYANCGSFGVLSFLFLRSEGHYDPGLYRRYRDTFPLVTDVPRPLLRLIARIPAAALRPAARAYRWLRGAGDAVAKGCASLRRAR